MRSLYRAWRCGPHVQPRVTMLRHMCAWLLFSCSLVACVLCRDRAQLSAFTVNARHSELSIRVEVRTLWRVGVWRCGLCGVWVYGGEDSVEGGCMEVWTMWRVSVWR